MELSDKYTVVSQTDNTTEDGISSPRYSWQWKRKVLNTVAICFGFFCLSVSRGMIGPTIPDLEVLIDATTAQMSYILAGRQLGFILGNAIGGTLFSLCSTWILLLISTLLFTPFLMIMPWMTNVIIFGCLISVGMFFAGFMVVGNMAIAKIWGDKHGPYLQALHCIYFAGFLFASLIAKPFLSDTPMEQQTSGINRNNTIPGNMNSTLLFNKDVSTQTSIATGNWTDKETHPLSHILDSQVQIPYMIAGALTILASVFYGVMLCMDRFWKHTEVEESSTPKTPEKSLDSIHKVTFVCLIFSLLFSYTSTEINYSVFLAVFLVQSHNYTPQKAAITLSVYFTAFVIGRALGIFAIKKITPKTLLAVGIILTVISNIILYFSDSHKILIWITISVAALGMSTQYATIVSWTTEYIALSGWTGTAILLSGATGYLIGPFLFGALFSVFGIDSFMYILSSAIVLEIILFLVLSIFVRILAK